MDALSAVAAALLATVFAVSGAAKLLDRRGTREAVEALGVPLPIAGAVTAVLPLVELALAVLLLPPATGRAAAVGATLLLVAFTTVVVANLLAGRRPRCGCFGGLGSSDVSWRTVARNGVLVVAGLMGTAERLWTPTAASIGVALAAVLIGVEQLLSRRAGTQAEAGALEDLEHALAVDDDHGPAPELALHHFDGAPVGRHDLLAPGLPVLLVLLNLGCDSCRELLPTAIRWQREYATRLSVVPVVRGSARDVTEQWDVGSATVLLASSNEDLAGYTGRGWPSAALITPGGRLAAPTTGGVSGVRRLLAVGLQVEPDPVTGVAAEDLDLLARPLPRRTVTVDDRDGALLVDEATGASLALDPLGILIWQTLDGTSTLGEIVADLAEVFSAPREVVGQDVLQFVRTCGEAGLLAGVSARGRTAV